MGQRLRVASIQAELNARRVQLKLNKDVAEHIRLLEKRVEKSASKAKLAIEEEEPSKNALVDAQSAESDAKIRANAARAAFEDAKGVYLVALKEEELQKSKLRAMEKKWKDDIDEKKKYAASAREAISTATTSEEEKKTLKSEARLELKKFANPYKLEALKALRNATAVNATIKIAENMLAKTKETMENLRPRQQSSLLLAGA